MSAAAVVARAKALGLRVASAESCTGGMIAAALTDVAGSSAMFGFGFVTYANEAKVALLGVDAAVLAAEGAVSEAVARAMAAGARARSGADVAVAVTGIAGPDGGSAAKPVGTVWCAVAGRDGVVAERRVFAGDRAAVRAATVAWALEMVMARLVV
ncbi:MULTISPECIES: CinA family protein [Acidiphilium]|uniref:Nicotinamide-nucleotide amidase n=1 Tax=Acidiphilium rubrum TaxID=526 RepID=A0A8G2CJE5_ACIRU|nr:MULTISPECIES: CinA family protein [Acidiphilium]SIQ49835.1 nicotinamide-nucleotide amidase [Acidiphilium rubrum]